MERQQIYEIEILPEMDGERMDFILSQTIPDTSRNFIQKLIEREGVRINDRICTSKKYKVQQGTRISITIPEPQVLDVTAENIPLDVVFEDEAVLVVNKPKGMVVHPAVGNLSGTLVNAIMYHCDGRLSSINGVIRPGIVHRIDKDTSGLLMVAKTDVAHKSLAEQLANHSITRTYWAIVYHNFCEEEGTVDAPIGRDPKNRLRQAVTDKNSRQAVTHYRVLERLGNFTLIQASLETGRTHQIRVHMAYIKHPLLGDPIYGPKKQIMNLQGQMLHAGILGFIHPTTGVYMEFNSSLPQEFESVLSKLR